MNTAAEEAIKTRYSACYDVCHFAVGYEEDHAAMIAKFGEQGIRTGKIQTGAALKDCQTDLHPKKKKVIALKILMVFVYSAPGSSWWQKAGSLLRYRDMPGRAWYDNDFHAGGEEWYIIT